MGSSSLELQGTAMKVLISSSLLLSSALAAVVPVAPGYAPAPAPYHPPPPAPYHPAPYHEEKLPPQPFAYEYGGADEYGRHFAKTETQDEYGVVQGEYRVELPDGRVQIVSYHADHENGFIADVRYEGEAHPEPVYKAPVHPVAHHAVHAAPVVPHHAVHAAPLVAHPVPVVPHHPVHHAVHAPVVAPVHHAV